MNQPRSNGTGNNLQRVVSPGRSGALKEPRSVTWLNAAHQINVRRSESESWVMAYLDVITLLLTAFILVMAFMSHKQEQMQEQQERESAYQQAEAQQYPDATAIDGGPELVKQRKQDDGLLYHPRSSDTPTLEQELVESLKAQQGLDELEIKVEPGRVNLALPENILFRTGQADLIGGSHRILDTIAPVLRDYSAPVSVEGHTDDLPITTARFPSNWELSSARATVVIRYLVERGVPRDLLRAIGYADTRPVAPNTYAEGRKENRRVNLVIHLDEA
jgi:chemotaxis protein MotB